MGTQRRITNDKCSFSESSNTVSPPGSGRFCLAFETYVKKVSGKPHETRSVEGSFGEACACVGSNHCLTKTSLAVAGGGGVVVVVRKEESEEKKERRGEKRAPPPSFHHHYRCHYYYNSSASHTASRIFSKTHVAQKRRIDVFTTGPFRPWKGEAFLS
jgi:hypothetical protein